MNRKCNFQKYRLAELFGCVLTVCKYQYSYLTKKLYLISSRLPSTKKTGDTHL